MRGRLLGHDDLKWLLSQPNVKSLINTMGNTPYRSDIEAALVVRKGVRCIELALQRNLGRILQKVISFYEEHEQNLLVSYLSYWDVFNVKTILRGIAEHTQPEEIIRTLVPVGELNINLLKELAQCTNVKAAIDLLATWDIAYSKPLTVAFPVYTKEKRLTVLEAAVDRFYYAHALEMCSGRGQNARLVREVIGREIDKTNVVNLLRLGTVSKSERSKWYELYGENPCARFLIPGGTEFPIEPFKKLPTCPGFNDVEKYLRRLSCYEMLKDTLEQYRRGGGLFFFERCMERELTRETISLFWGDPLSIAIPLAYIRSKTNEVINIRIITRGIELGMSSEDITKELVIV